MHPTIRLLAACCGFLFPTVAVVNGEVVKASQETDFRARHQIEAPVPSERYLLQISADLQDWEGKSLVFDSASVNWQMMDSEEVAITYQRQLQDGSWAVEFELRTGAELYTRLVPLPLDVVRAGANTDYRAVLEFAPHPSSIARYTLEISANLQDWEGKDLSFDASRMAWRLDSTSEEVRLLYQNQKQDGSWSVEVALPAGREVYTRIKSVLAPQPVGAKVNPETRNLLASLHRIGWDPDKIMFGQEFPLSFNHRDSFNDDLAQSDCKDVTGDHPGVHGSDFHYMMWNNDAERPTHVEAARIAYHAGAMVTFDFHWRGKYSNDFYYHERDAELLYNVTHGDDSEGDVTWFYGILDEVLHLVNEEIQVPIVFRPLHEMNGNWFWWGSRMKGGAEVYRQAYRLMFDYMSERSEYLLWCWSPDKALALDYYPGDEYVDIIGMDVYDAGVVPWATVEQMIGWLEEAVDFAAERGKVAAFTETGNRVDYPDANPTWWTENVLEPILASPKARQIAWILTWINAPWADNPYVPTLSSSQAAQDDFKAFAEHPVTLFQSDVAAESLYAPQD